MKMRTFRSLALVVLVCGLVFSLTGCKRNDYRNAVDMYNAGYYESAAEMFSALGDYEDSAELVTLCRYWDAVTLAEQGSFEKALPRFLKLGSYENSAQWVTECQYQIAVTAFGEERFAEAREAFLETPGYKNTPEYLRQITWQSLFDAVIENGVDHISTIDIEKERNGRTYMISAVHNLGDTQALVLEVSQGSNGDYFIFDGLKITLTRDSTVAQFECSSGFGMDYLGGRIGSSQLATGKIDITTCTPETRLVVETFEKNVTDNQGNQTTSTDPADSLMDETMADLLRDLLTVVPELLLEAGITVTLQGIGFSAL